MFQLTSKLLNSESKQVLPTCDNPHNLANIFVQFFEDKIKTIREKFDVSSITTDRQAYESSLSAFRPATETEIHNVIMSSPTKSCQLDPIPTWLLKQCLPDLLPLITSIVNKSLNSGSFPTCMEHVLVRPLLKKTNLDPNELKNYRPEII